MIKKNIILFIIFIYFLPTLLTAQNESAPAYPLITLNPYFSIWSVTDKLNESTTEHWTGADQSLIGIIKVDNEYYKFLGEESNYKDLSETKLIGNAFKIKYTVLKPSRDWTKNSFNDNEWTALKEDDTTSTKDVYERIEFNASKTDWKNLFLKTDNGSKIVVYLNGEQIYSKIGWRGGLHYVNLQRIVGDKIKGANNILSVWYNYRDNFKVKDAVIAEKEIVTESHLLSAVQNSVIVQATQTIYNFTCGKVNLNVKFISPLLLNNIDLIGSPVSYINYCVKSNDDKQHKVQVYFGASTDIAVNSPDQEVLVSSLKENNMSLLKAGTKEQAVLKKRGDNQRIDWGYFYAAVQDSSANQYISKSVDDGIKQFTAQTFKSDNSSSGKSMMLNTVLNLGNINKSVERTIAVAYDQEYAIQYFGQNLRPWWNRDGNQNIIKVISNSLQNFSSIKKQCDDFDKSLHLQAENAGGKEYAHLCNLAYRQSIAAHSLVESPQGEILFLSKENFSNGCINTIDVTYPSSPLYLLYNPAIFEGMLNGIFYYCESGKWQKNFAPHDLGTFPQANGQVYKEDMPVEESANMIILTDAICKAEGNTNYARKHWKLLTQWANYLIENGFDPANQLCTDDFGGHLAHNANLSLKAILAIASYAQLAKNMGMNDVAATDIDVAKKMAKQWADSTDAGDHYSLVFGDKKTWSQKYNLVWDKVLNLGIFPKTIYKKETDYYLSKQNKYGLPLDSRRTYTKSDWIMWTATLTSDKSDFEKFVIPVNNFATSTPDRVPLTDFHETVNAEQVMPQARSVVGGYFMKLLGEKFKN